MKKLIFAILLCISLCLSGCVAYYIPDNEYPNNNLYPETQENIEQMKDIVINENLIYDNNGVKIYTKRAEQTDKTYNIYFYIENNSDLNLGFNAHSYAINKVNTANNIYEMDFDVSAGKKANGVLEIEKTVLKQLNISEIKCIDILFWAYDNDKMYKSFDTGQITISTDLDDGLYNFYSNESIYEKDGISVKYINNNDGKYNFVLENNTTEYIDFDVENLTINDFTSSDKDYDLMRVSALQGCYSYFTIIPSEEFLKINNIDVIEKIEFDITINPFESYKGNWKTETISIELK